MNINILPTFKLRTGSIKPCEINNKYFKHMSYNIESLRKRNKGKNTCGKAKGKITVQFLRINNWFYLLSFVPIVLEF